MKKLIIKCPLCEKKYETILSTTLHWSRTHHLKSKELYLKLNDLTKEPTCACGCGSPVKFLDCGRGFSEYKWGHAAKVPGKNNWGNNEKALKKSHATVKKMIKNGLYKPFYEKETGKYWATGNTVETDERVARAVAARETPEHKKISSKRMKEPWENGSIVPLYGPDHSQWKDGTSSLHAYCHGNKKLYDEWKYPKLIASGFSCSVCKGTKELNVHHNKEKMCDIIRKIAINLGWNNDICSREELDPELQLLKHKIANAVADYHIDNDISAQVLCETCHKNTHANLNF